MWYIKYEDGSERGPVGPLELLELIRSGAVLRKTQLRKDDSQWVDADQVNGLWSAAAKPSMVYHCPHCGKIIPKPPTRCSKCELHIDRASSKLVQHDLDAVERKAKKRKAPPAPTPTPPRATTISSSSVDNSSSGPSSAGDDAGSSKPSIASKWIPWLRKQ